MATSSRFGASRYSPNWRGPRTPYGNLVPNVTHSSSERPHSDVAAAAWLPINDSATNQGMGFFVRREEPTGDYLVMTPGKLVAVTRENLGLEYDEGPLGRLVPAGVRINWAAAASGTNIIEYTALDVAEFIEDVTTGEPVAAAVSYTKNQVTVALRARGLLRSTESAEEFISKPVGVAPQSVYAWCGGDGLQPAGYRQHNYKRQHKSQLLCDWALRLPFVPPAALVQTTTVAVTGNEATGIADLEAGVNTWVTGGGGGLAALGLTARYGTPAHSDYVGFVVGAHRIEVAPHIPMLITSGGNDITSQVAVRRMSSINDLSYEGDYYIDTELGIIFFYESGGNALPNGLTVGDIINVSAHGALAPGAAAYVTDLASVGGDVRPGDLLVCDAQSNFRPFVPRPAETTIVDNQVEYVDPATYDRPEDVVAQVLTFSRYPDEGMDMVKTFYDNLPTGLADRMPGSATEGYTDNLTYALGGQFEVIVNFLK